MSKTVVTTISDTIHSIALILLVVLFPELHWTNVGRDEDRTAQDWVQGRRENGRHDRLEKQHCRIFAVVKVK